ncbi:hypothetical protein H0274_07330 [Altererythrobacter sp. CC-YST694]|uniref:hypothetical protein n=1 Tax=Altererythrobacter sp. CC-YST694 TaxID=2755038 RepID=UPI001D01FE7A|nr:hypothetical protein [Altererythrobacter sp. CC-YST694]MCB5425062.1 hypothetical protein [Altererythrobacter sp. CC-YST694]
MLAYELTLAVSPEASWAAWHGGVGEESAIYLQPLGVEGAMQGSPIRLSSEGKAFAYEPDLILAGGSPVAAWYQKNPFTNELSGWLAGLDASGQREWLVPLELGADWSRNPVVRLAGDRLLVAWIGQPSEATSARDPAIWYREFSLAGKPLAAPREVGRGDRDTWNLNATVAGGAMVIAYDAAGAREANELHLIEVTAKGARPVQLTPDDGNASLYPDLQVNEAGIAALTWFDERDGNREIYLSIGLLADFLAGPMPPPIRVTHGEGESLGAYLAWNGDRVGLVWSDEVGSDRHIFAQGFNSAGQPLGAAHQLSTGSGKSSIPVIRASGKGFLVAWNDYEMEETGGHAQAIWSLPQIARFDP